MSVNENYTISGGYYLPSGGSIYSKPVNPNVELRSMTARDEMKRLSPTPNQFKLLADIIEGCMLEKPAVHVYDMALGDYEYLLHKLRVVTYGDEYKMIVNCPDCGEQVEVTAHLDELEVRGIEADEFEKLSTVTLPKSGHIIGLKFQTPRDLDEANIKAKEMERKYKEASINFKELVTLEQAIKTIDGEPCDSIKLEAFINKLPAADMLKIQNAHNTLNNSIGLNSLMKVICPKCGEEFTTFFRFGPEFFRPTTV